MSDKPVRVNVTFKFPSAANAGAFAALFRDEFIGRTRKEEGCLLYDVWQANDDPCVLTLIETWTSQQTLDQHLAQPWMQETLPKAMALLGEGNKPAFHFCTSVMD
jgi:quinol monooxygenase YgiN